MQGIPNKLMLVLGVIVVFVSCLEVAFGEDLGTPEFTAKPKTILNGSYPATFYYSTNDDVTIFDEIRLGNYDSRDITVEFVGKTEGEEGWFAFASNPVDVPGKTIFNPQDETFSVTIPDGVCEGVYEGTVFVNLIDYDGKTDGDGFAVTSTVAVDVIFDITSGLVCADPLPGLGAAPTFRPPDTVVGQVLEEGPVVVPAGGGGGPSLLLGAEGGGAEEAPEEAPPEEEEEVLGPIVLNLLGHPEKRIPKTGNWDTRARIKIYTLGGGELLREVVTPTDENGEGMLSVDLDPGFYDVSFKGLSHLTKFLRHIYFNPGVPVDLDFTLGGAVDLLAGDVHLSKDDLVNALDFSASAVALYGSNIHADLNDDGIVNALDLSIEAINIYETGEPEIPENSFAGFFTNQEL